MPQAEIKTKLISAIVARLEADLKVLTDSAFTAREAATHEESRAEDKYDTRGLEASYLAGAQAKRAQEIQKLIQEFRRLQPASFDADKPVAATALVELEIDEKESRWFFIVPRAGAMNLQIEGLNVQVLTALSPLGEEMIGREVDSEFEFESGGRRRNYRLCQIL